MLIEPGIEVKYVVDQPPPNPDRPNTQGGQQGDPNPQIISRLLAGEAAGVGEGQGWQLIAIHRPWPSCMREPPG